MDEIHPGLVASVLSVMSDASIIEMNTIYLCLILNQDPTGVLGYEKLKPLFTEDNGAKMNRDTETIFKSKFQQILKEQK